MGTPEFAVPALEAVARACDVAQVVTRPDRPRGRGRSSSASPVGETAERLGLPVLKPERVNAPDAQARLAGLNADLFVVVAFGAVLSPALLQTPRLGAINLHASLLPAYRGASPVQRVLWDGRAATGVTTLWMDEGIDTGDMILQQWAPIAPEDDAGVLAGRLADMGAPLLAESVTRAHQGTAPRVRQPETGASYAGKLRKEDGAVRWDLDAVTVWNRQRAVTPWPGAAAELRGGLVLITRCRPAHVLPLEAPPGRVLAVSTQGVLVACGAGALMIERVKPEGRSEMAAADWARGARLEPGSTLESRTIKEAHA